ncbi:MAG: cytochrome c biogenesis heme-transporting ATPase CcmA [Methylococcaceae bacterium]|nr:cytochrome c biogenesis heme-transporting ATPase CcmA [Methylococcaceae bacterium]
MNQKKLEARKLSCIRDDKTLFNDLNFTLTSGQVLLIEGANGAGKTSLLRILTGFRKPDVGDLFWNDEMIDDTQEFYQDTAYIGHNNGLKDTLTADENLRYAQALAINTLTIDAALDQVGLNGYQETLVRFMSAGQKRRLALARLLCTYKPLWILDEPFTSLDRASIKLFEIFIEKHAKQDGLVIMTSHHDTLIPHALLQKIHL